MTGRHSQRHRPVVLTDEMLATAACRGIVDAIQIFFPDKPGPQPTAPAAKLICARCPLTGLHGPCVQDAVNHDDAGIRGGLTHDQRRQARVDGRLQRQNICPICRTVFTDGHHRWLHCSGACAAEADRQSRNAASHRAWLRHAAS